MNDFLKPTGKDDPAYHIPQGPARKKPFDGSFTRWPYHEAPLLPEMHGDARIRLRIIKRRCKSANVDYIDAVWKARDASQ